MAPKTKQELIAALMERTTIDHKFLQELPVERLRLLHQATKPRVVRPLPANWRRFKKAELEKIYTDTVVPFLQMGAEPEEVRAKWNRDHFVMEISNYAMMLQEEQGLVMEADPEGPPACPKCSVAMVERRNRTTGDKFWGCLLYPRCRETRPGADQAGYPRQPGRGSGSRGPSPVPQLKHVNIDGNENMDGDMRRRAIRTPVPSETNASWSVMEEAGKEMKVSAEEARFIMQMRAAQKEADEHDRDRLL